MSLKRAIERKRFVDILDLGKSDSIPKIVNVEAFKPIVTRSEKVLRVLKEAELHAGSDVPVLITGETGTGKELLARAIHASSTRNEYAFIPINMDSLTDQLFNAEFFGHTKGAFTGAEKERAGYLEYTHKGTLFLDEIGNLQPELQGKLPLLLERFLKEYCGERGANFEEATLSLLMNYDYPGNIRELKSIIQSAVNLSQGRPIAPRHLPVPIQKITSNSKIAIPAGTVPVIPLADVEKKHILIAYNQTKKNKSLTAKLLRIGENTLRRKLISYGVE